MKRGGPLRRHAPLATRTQVRRYNEQRRAARLAEDFGPKAEWVRTLRCATCERSPPPSEPSHVRTRAAGGKQGFIPQCWSCHQALHSEGVETFQSRRGIDLEALVQVYAAGWRTMPRAQRQQWFSRFAALHPEAAEHVKEEP